MSKAQRILEAAFEFSTLEDILNTIRKLEPGEYDISNLVTFTASSNKVSVNEVQAFIKRHEKVCYIKLEGYSEIARDLILLSNVPKKIVGNKPLKDSGVIVFSGRLIAQNLE